mgnify:CR=1 FL=1
MNAIITVALVGLAVSATSPKYTQDELYCLSHIINAEAGDSNCSHEHRIAVGSVVLNRVASDEFPDTIYDVVFQPGQYSPTWNGAYDKEPSEDSVEVAKMLLEEGSQIPEDCVFQAEFAQGSGVYETFETVYGTTYICYR